MPKDTSIITHGMMSGSNEGVMKALEHLLPEETDAETFGAPMDYPKAREYMSELWLRGISKEDFIAFTKGLKKSTI